ncbi:hypothetical protein Ocin01_03765 [Orchesella cincta]|uniref:Uncharacterized protein n=1 Tax=Orchesella cincta TaxID=48709 RepID=A0A1D2NCE3_ORCCI|nr:hypothetical protein Ocin01_03765 [Orchesella cincta]
MAKVALFIFITAVVAISFALDCSDVIRKEQEGVLSWLGNITFNAPVSTGPSGWTLTLFFDRNFTGVGVWDGFVSFNRDERWAEITNRNSTDAVIEAGEKKSLRFRVNFDGERPNPDVPEVISLRFQDIELCN